MVDGWRSGGRRRRRGAAGGIRLRTALGGPVGATARSTRGREQPSGSPAAPRSTWTRRRGPLARPEVHSGPLSQPGSPSRSTWTVRRGPLGTSARPCGPSMTPVSTWTRRRGPLGRGPEVHLDGPAVSARVAVEVHLDSAPRFTWRVGAAVRPVDDTTCPLGRGAEVHLGGAEVHLGDGPAVSARAAVEVHLDSAPRSNWRVGAAVRPVDDAKVHLDAAPRPIWPRPRPYGPSIPPRSTWTRRRGPLGRTRARGARTPRRKPGDPGPVRVARASRGGAVPCHASRTATHWGMATLGCPELPEPRDPRASPSPRARPEPPEPPSRAPEPRARQRAPEPRRAPSRPEPPRPRDPEPPSPRAPEP